MTTTRRALLAAPAIASLARGAAAQGFPDKPIRIVVPFAAGGTSDVLSRALGEALKDQRGWQVIVDNRTGGNSAIAMDNVARSPADGYTLAYLSHGSMVTNPLVYRRLAYKPEDFLPLTPIFTAPNMVAVKKGFPATDMRSFAAYVKAQRAPLPYGTVGTGSAPHLMMEKLQGIIGAEMTMVPYRGDAPAAIDLAAGHLECMSGSIQSVLEAHRDGQVKILAVTGPERAPVLPDVPTLAEAGFPELTYTYWQGLGVRADTPSELVRTLHDAILQGMDSPSLRNRMSSEMVLSPMTTEAFVAAIRADQENWRKVVQDRNVFVD